MIKDKNIKKYPVKNTKETKKITLLIPCYNEADGIGAVIDGLPKQKLKEAGYKIEVVVIDNNSTDDTASVAKSHGARVINEPKKGKGNAIKAGFNAVLDDTEYVVMIDGDDTYETAEILRLIEPLENGFCDAVMGSRLAGKMTANSMKGFNRLGNWFFSVLVRNFFKVNITDTLTGYFAWRYDVISKMRPYIISDGFSIEMEMIAKQAKLGFEAYSVPITYAPRVGDSSLKPVSDGIKIFSMFSKMLFWNPPAKEAAPKSSGIIYASESVNNKNTDLFIRTITKVKNVYPGIKCFIFCNKSKGPALKQSIKSQGLKENVELIDYMNSQDKINKHLKDSRVLVFPDSHKKFGLIVTEASRSNIDSLAIKGNSFRKLEEKKGSLSEINTRRLAKQIIHKLEETESSLIKKAA